MSFKDLSIRTKFLLLFSWLALVSIFLTGWLSYRSAKAALETITFDWMTTVRESQKQAIESYFRDAREDMTILPALPAFVNATKAFADATSALKPRKGKSLLAPAERQALGTYYEKRFLPKLQRVSDGTHTVKELWPKDDIAQYLQYHYIAASPFTWQERSRLNQASDRSRYSAIHAQVHPVARNVVQAFDFYDLYLIDARTGIILYSFQKEADFGTSLLTGPYRNTKLGRAFRQAKKGAVTFVDFEHYPPSHLLPAAFFAAPIFDGKRITGVMAAQISSDRINDLMTSRHNWRAVGLGESGETYLIGDDYKLRSDARPLVERPSEYARLLLDLGADPTLVDRIALHSTSILYQEIRTEAPTEALRGVSGTKIITDYRGVSALSSYTPLNITDVHWALIAKIDAAEALAPVHQLRDTVRGLGLIVTLFSGFLGYLVARSFLRPILQLTARATELGQGNLSERVPVTSRDELGLLASSFNQMAENLQRAEEELREATNRELQIARDIQMGILPTNLSSFTIGTGLDVQAALEPAQLVGGDLYEVTRTDDGRVVVIMGDVSGKGIPAALFMAVTVTLLRTKAPHFARPEELLRRVNEDLVLLNPHTMFVTLLCGMFDTRGGTVSWASAGHMPPVLIRRGQRPTLPFDEQGTVAGISAGIEIQSHTMPYKPGDTFILYTDGVTEAYNPDGDLLGEQPFLDQLAQRPGRTAREAAAAVVEIVRRHAAGASQSDDIAVLAVHVADAGEGTPHQSAEQTLRIPNDPEALEQAQATIESFLTGREVPAELVQDVRLVLDEVLSNIMRYGYGSRPGDIDLSATASTDRIRLVVRDRASRFNPLEQPDPDFNLPADDRPVGGLGVYLIRQLMDRVDYVYEEGANTLMMERRIRREDESSVSRLPDKPDQAL